MQFAVWFTVLPLVRAFITRRVHALRPEQSAAPLELMLALLKKTTRLFLIVVATWLALRWLAIPEQFDRWIMGALLFVLWLQVARWGTATVNYFIEQRRRRDETAAAGAASLNILRFVGVAIVWSVAFTIPEQLDRWIMGALLFVLWWQVAMWGSATVRYFIEQKRQRDDPTSQGAASLNILRFVGVAPSGRSRS